MKKILLSLLIVLGLSQFLGAKKIAITKGFERQNLEIKKVHPVEKYFNKASKKAARHRDFNNKLLILLIDFPLEQPDDPETTGNGKFVQVAGNYPISIGSPPHNHAYFEDIGEALRQYYLAVSYGDFDLEIDIFPQSEDGDFSAYTLPQAMSYYNPDMADQDLMIERFEEYFADAFETADEDSLIIFSDYSHYMFIHAGADWQHDIFGDTPHDIPSFFIEMDENPYITESGFEITHACNIPETIVQDTIIDTSGAVTIVDNYGVINSVLVHEFGHSIGFVDLYNTYNHTPQVGYYDIMDSGGSSIINFGVTENGEDIYYSFEGIVPAFPGAFSRIIAFEDSYRARGILKDITDFDFDSKITLLPCESIYDETLIDKTTAYFVKIPINETEYILLENRQIDPDGDDDGNLYLTTNADTTVILHPTYPPSNPDDSNNYEYDYLLPGWLDENYRSYGGGILMWHIDEERLYENDAFENNSVNVYHSRRSVRIIEADNIEDIGNPYSMYWKGTAYEPFYRYKPLINEDGFFTGWNDDYIVNPEGEIEFIGEYFNHEYSATSSPAFVDNNGNPSIFSIYDISSYAIDPFQQRTMSFKFGTNLFDETQKIAEFDSIQAIGLMGQFENSLTFPVVADGEIKFYSPSDTIPLFETEFLENVNFPIFKFNDEFAFVSENKITLINPETEEIEEMIYSSNITDVPIFIENWYFPTWVIPTEDSLFVGDFARNIPNANCVFDGSHLVVATENKIQFIPDPNLDGAPYYEVEIANYDPKFIPIIFDEIGSSQNDATFVQNKNGDIFKIKNGVAEKIFSLYPYSDKTPSQLALCKMDENIYLTFGAENRIFAITLNGTLKDRFPAYLENKSIKSEKFPRVITFDEDVITFLEEENGGYIAIDQNGDFRMEYSFYWRKNNLDDHFYWNDITNSLYYVYADNEHRLYAASLNEITENSIMWNGLRNGEYSIFASEVINFEPETEKLVAFAFPNPARNGEVRIRIENAKAEKIDIKIFDIAANMLLKRTIERELNDYQDFCWNTKKISSGIYFAIINSAGESKKIKFAVVN